LAADNTICHRSAAHDDGVVSRGAKTRTLGNAAINVVSYLSVYQINGIACDGIGTGVSANN
jgi:hypothetical protein